MNNITFFLIDDDVDDTLLFQEVLGELEFPVNFNSAVNGHVALKKLQKENAILPDVIFLDLNMPVMDGKECLAHLKADTQLSHVPVIMYTTSSQSKDIEETLMSGAVCFITKPTSLKALREILLAIARSLPHNLDKTLRQLSHDTNTYIVI